MASTDENPGLLARFYGSRQESSTRRKSAERPFPHNVRGSDATKYMNQMQLLSGFLLLRDDVMERELQTAAERHGLDLDTLAFEQPWNQPVS